MICPECGQALIVDPRADDRGIDSYCLACDEPVWTEYELDQAAKSGCSVRSDRHRERNDHWRRRWDSM